MATMTSYLISGTGPVAVQLACIFGRNEDAVIDMVGRSKDSIKSQTFYQAYQKHGQLKVSVQNKAHAILEGEHTLRQLYADYQEVVGRYDTLILACTCDAYISVLQQLSKDTLRHLKHIILVSPTLGSHIIVQQWMAQYQKEVEVIVFSTYLGDTRIVDSKQPYHVCTTGVKSHLYVGSTHKSHYYEQMINMFRAMHIQLRDTETPFQAETRNSSLYVHPPLFMNAFSLNAIFNGTDVPVYVYKLFPEGPITMTLIREMRQMWQEMNKILLKLNVPSMNLLKFMVKENYPVRQETLDERDIEQFETLSTIHQEYLLYVRYTAILIDPFSEPNQEGRYFDFSAVPFKRIFKNEQDQLQIPRMPSEDYYRTKIIQQMGRLLDVDTPMIDTLLRRYETQLVDYKRNHPNEHFTKQFDVCEFEQDTAMLRLNIETART